MFVCKICGSEVESGQAFCRKCGADVVENYETVCPTCGSKNGAGSRYCAKCGGILQIIRKPVCAVCGAKNLPGARFCVSCGAPVILDGETHSDAEILDAREAKQKLDAMERERMAAVDKEIAEKRKKTLLEKEQSVKEIEDYRAKANEELTKQANLLDSYRKKLNEMGAEDVNLLKKISSALKDYSVYYADPYSELDEDDIDGETYVCPACGTVNPVNVTACAHCGRKKARAALLLAKGKIKQSRPVKRKKDIIPPPKEDLCVQKTPTFDEYAGGEFEEAQTKPIEKEIKEEKKEASDFSGPGAQPYFNGYAYPPYPYPYPPTAFGAPAFFNAQTGEPYQMPPIVQPVAFVPYVTQEQPLMQYSPNDVTSQPAKKSAANPSTQSAGAASSPLQVKHTSAD